MQPVTCIKWQFECCLNNPIGVGLTIKFQVNVLQIDLQDFASELLRYTYCIWAIPLKTP